MAMFINANLSFPFFAISRTLDVERVFVDVGECRFGTFVWVGIQSDIAFDVNSASVVVVCIAIVVVDVDDLFFAVVNIFISSPLEVRVKRIARRLEVNEQKARELISKTDKSRAEYYNYYSSKTWGAAATYHLCIDSDCLGMKGTEEYIKDFVKRKLGL